MMLVVTPRRRATAQGLGLLASHLLGDAASPVLIGMVVVSCRYSLHELIDWLQVTGSCRLLLYLLGVQDSIKTSHHCSMNVTLTGAASGNASTPCAHNSTVRVLTGYLLSQTIDRPHPKAGATLYPEQTTSEIQLLACSINVPVAGVRVEERNSRCK